MKCYEVMAVPTLMHGQEQKEGDHVYSEIQGLQLPRESYRSTILLQLTDGSTTG